ncbi:hypothetical protein [Lutimaribacter saemankumensis]|uniref:Uncharacterized protein n=1 Tax=Lutimaribacter saemankumensis TaxID=490829 RepID=A0A1G8IK84_9RHOB|nr:hypothetical protein [Lutimaribacter saemankumensis]SDI19197.1 hypothetical protein SAMN05421850_101952 [Lutimaribacter saemankumensis]
MKLKEFIAGLAEVMQVESTELATVDRALAKQGLRQLARGRFHPDITLEEGVQLVCAWAGSFKLTEAASEVERLKSFSPRQIPNDEYELITKNSKTFASLFGAEERDLYGMNFVEAACWLTEQLGSGKYPADRIWLSVTKGGEPEMSGSWRFKFRTLSFFQFPETLDFDRMKPVPQRNVEIKASIRGPVLKWIFDVTEVS